MTRPWRRRVKALAYRAVQCGETVLFGSRFRGDLLAALLQQYHRSLFRREWRWSAVPPHFENQRCFLGLWSLRGDRPWPLGRNPDFLTRGFLNRELLRAEHTVLDIGCGDGFFDYLFYSGAVRHLDAIDIDPAALALAARYHRAANVTYHRLNAVTEPLPRAAYDVVLWDGAIGHFTEEDVAIVMSRIRRVLGPRGILAGSEALETLEQKTWDHHLAFPDLAALRQFLLRFFPHVQVKEIPPMRGRYREGYFRCGMTAEALNGHGWQ